MMCKQHSSNLYEVLGICTDATAAEVRAAYYRAALRTHPDKGGNAEDFRLANRAFEVLSCPASRKLYDSSELPLSRPSSCPATTAESATPARSRQKQTRLFPRRHAHMKAKKTKKPLDTTVTAMHRLKVILQAMNVKSRREVFTGMTESMKKALHRFMTDTSYKVSPHVQRTSAYRARPARHKPQPDATCVRTINRARKTMYQAQMHVKALRLYARPQETLDSAIQHRIEFSALRSALAAGEKADPNFWLDADKVYQTCEAAFKEMATSETNLGLRAFAHIRATSWLGLRIQITSPSTTLRAALDAHARLLVARATSWELFRTEWIHLMLEKKRFTLTEAEAVADGARQTELQYQVAKALRGVEKALNKEQRRARTHATFCAKMQAVVAAEVVEKTRPKRSRTSNVAFMGG